MSANDPKRTFVLVLAIWFLGDLTTTGATWAHLRGAGIPIFSWENLFFCVACPNFTNCCRVSTSYVDTAA
jgi:hypothetical protein